MLSSDPKRLRFLGIDLHSRIRRRWLVVLAYLFYFFALAAIGSAFEGRQAFPSEHLLLFIVSFGFLFFAPLSGIKGPVKSFDDVRRPAGGKLFGKGVILRNLDDWAKYRYGDVFDAITPEQQQKLLRVYRVGNYLLPFKSASSFDTEIPDERELAERDRASHQALRFLGLMLICSAVIVANNWNRHGNSGDLTATFLEFAVTALTLPQAIILWHESDPRQDQDLKAVPPMEPASPVK